MKIYNSLEKYFKDLTMLFNITNLPYDCIVVVDKTTVATGLDGDINEEYCDAHGIEHFNINYEGGTIVMAKDGIGLCRLSSIEYGFRNDTIWQEFIKYLNNKGIENVEYKDNDLLIDGYKVASDGFNLVGNGLKTVYTTYQFSINQDIDTIKAVCNKEMDKTPRGLGFYGITKEDVISFIEEFIKNEAPQE